MAFSIYLADFQTDLEGLAVCLTGLQRLPNIYKVLGSAPRTERGWGETKTYANDFKIV